MREKVLLRKQHLLSQTISKQDTQIKDLNMIIDIQNKVIRDLVRGNNLSRPEVNSLICSHAKEVVIAGYFTSEALRQKQLISDINSGL